MASACYKHRRGTRKSRPGSRDSFSHLWVQKLEASQSQRSGREAFGAASLPARLLRKHLPKRKDAAGASGLRFPEYLKSQKSCWTQQRRSSVDGSVGPTAETDEKLCPPWRIPSDSSQRTKRWSGLNLPVDRRRKPGGIGASAGRCDRLQTALYRFLAADG